RYGQEGGLLCGCMPLPQHIREHGREIKNKPFCRQGTQIVAVYGRKSSRETQQRIPAVLPEKATGGETPLPNHEQCYEQIIENHLQCGEEQDTILTGLHMSRPERN